MGGGAILGLLLGLNYYVKQSQYHVFGVTTIIIALITYCIAPLWPRSRRGSTSWS